MKAIKKYIFLILLILYEETIFMIFTKGNISLSMITVLFTIQISLILGSLFLFKRKINKIIGTILVSFIPLIYVIQFIYYKIFGTVLSVNLILNSQQITKFNTQILTLILSNWYILLLMLLPLMVYLFFIRNYSLEKSTKKELSFALVSSFTIYIITILVINQNNTQEIYSIKNLYHNINNMSENINEFGVLTSVRLDLQRTIFGFKEKKLYKYEDSNGKTKILNEDEYNMISIDFDSLIENEENEDIKEIHNYIKLQEPTKKNEYTGIFEGKNIIVILGESFSSLAINEEITPTLYKLANKGFKFNNFYTPLFPVSTADGQYLSDTSLIPAEGMYSIQEVDEKQFPYVYGNIFKSLGYKTYAYHNYEYDYYKRDIYFKTFGYDKYLALNNGLEKRMDFSLKPSSDYDMIKTTINDYVKEDKFLAYYVTMSGHINYDKTNAMVNKNWSKVENLPYSDKAKAYLATQIELDKAVEEIINVLEKNNKLDDTVIIISGDHYPYGLSEDEIRELSPHDMNNYEIEKFHMPLIIYNGENQETIEVDKYGSSLDILPTVLNLFGIKYDSRLLMGKDILSDYEPLIIFSNRSFITNVGIYNSSTRTFTPHEKTTKDYSEYVQTIQQQIYLKYRYSRIMLKNDYYSYIEK